MIQPPTLVTPRLTLRPHRSEDFTASCRLWAEQEVTRFIGGRPSTPEEVWSRILRHAGHWSLLGFGYFALIETATGTLVGEAGLANFHRGITPSFGAAREAGWAVLPHYQGQGLAREAMTAILAWSDTQAPGRTVCLVHPDNQASLRLAGALGYGEYARTIYKDTPAILLARER